MTARAERVAVLVLKTGRPPVVFGCYPVDEVDRVISQLRALGCKARKAPALPDDSPGRTRLERRA
jgi:hypothetical protein